MRNYSICYLDAQARTQKTEFLPFENNRQASDFARIGIVSNAIVEVWHDNTLVERIYQDKAPIVVHEPSLASGATLTAAPPGPNGKKSFEAWDNEGGAPAPGAQ